METVQEEIDRVTAAERARIVQALHAMPYMGGKVIKMDRDEPIPTFLQRVAENLEMLKATLKDVAESNQVCEDENSQHRTMMAYVGRFWYEAMDAAKRVREQS